MKDRVILHCDLNNFYASVELLERPELREKPVAVCGSAEDRHGIVLAKNDVAKKIGVKTAETIFQAQQKCPDLVILDAHYKKYMRYSKIVRNILYRYTDILEPFGPDESWMDVTGSVRLFGSGEEMAYQIKETIKAETGLTVSIGVSFNKVFAKLGSDYKKPDAITVISEDNFKEKIYDLSADSMIGVGRHTYEKLKRLGIYTIGDLADSDIRALRNAIGVVGERLRYYAMGMDMSPVIAQKDLPEVKSISRSTTTKNDLETEAQVWKTFIVLSEDIAKQMIENDFLAFKLAVMVRDNTLVWESFTESFQSPLRFSAQIAQRAMALFRENYDWKAPLRSVGIAVSELAHSDAPLQLNFYSEEGSAPASVLDEQVIKIREKFGKNAIQIASVVDCSASDNVYKSFSQCE
ncbi:MAG: DNA polymerase IV [Clostridia bacterium]|nr:DNA polymerase IV [Clostridia bacterium]